VKEFLSREGHEFVIKSIEEDSQAYDQLIDLGFRVVPVTIVNGQAVKGFDVQALREALAGSSRS
jgi:glutaredoxin